MNERSKTVTRNVLVAIAKTVGEVRHGSLPVIIKDQQ